MADAKDCKGMLTFFDVKTRTQGHDWVTQSGVSFQVKPTCVALMLQPDERISLWIHEDGTSEQKTALKSKAGDYHVMLLDRRGFPEFTSAEQMTLRQLCETFVKENLIDDVWFDHPTKAWPKLSVWSHKLSALRLQLDKAFQHCPFSPLHMCVGNNNNNSSDKPSSSVSDVKTAVVGKSGGIQHRADVVYTNVGSLETIACEYLLDRYQKSWAVDEKTSHVIGTDRLPVSTGYGGYRGRSVWVIHLRLEDAELDRLWSLAQHVTIFIHQPKEKEQFKAWARGKDLSQWHVILTEEHESTLLVLSKMLGAASEWWIHALNQHEMCRWEESSVETTQWFGLESQTLNEFQTKMSRMATNAAAAYQVGHPIVTALRKRHVEALKHVLLDQKVHGHSCIYVAASLSALEQTELPFTVQAWNMEGKMALKQPDLWVFVTPGPEKPVKSTQFTIRAKPGVDLDVKAWAMRLWPALLFPGVQVFGQSHFARMRFPTTGLSILPIDVF